MATPPSRLISRLLIANRGEISIRILQSVKELPSPRPVTYALYTNEDDSHIALGRPDHALKLPSPASYMDIDHILSLVKKHKIDAIHPGYGFLSESADFASRAWLEANCIVIGPGSEILERTGDKLRAKSLAQECGVPVLQAMVEPTNSIAQVQRFANSVGYPIMVKAVDGGGGRGIRLVEATDQLENAINRCIAESPSRMVFAEQAAVQNFKHIEVQIVGDGRGGARHLWERDCSVQRRFQKIVEVAPAPVTSEQQYVTIVAAIESAISMAKRLCYLGLGTWEFLLNMKENKYFFLEINPRIQVEHTISEQIGGVDLVKEQFLIAQGFHSPDQWASKSPTLAERPHSYSIQMRVCAEDPKTNFGLSIGKIKEIELPSGNGVRVDSHLSRGGVVGTEFDNMMAKIIVTAPSWDETVRKAQRALEDIKIVGVATNLALLRGILADATFRNGDADTTWLEREMSNIIASGDAITKAAETASMGVLKHDPARSSNLMVPSSNAGVFLKKGDSWSVTLQEQSQAGESKRANPAPHHLKLDRVIRNNFPETLTADISYTIPGAPTVPYTLDIATTQASSESTASTRRQGDPQNESHIVFPISGKVVEVAVEVGDVVKENEVIAFVKQMKMELEIRSPRSGTITWVFDLEEDEGSYDVNEGTLLAELQDAPPAAEMKSKI